MRATRHESDLFGEFLNRLVFRGFKMLAYKSTFQKDFFNEIGMISLSSLKL